MFTSLITLDLSYNRLTGDDILALGLLVNLRTLHLTGKSRGMLNGKIWGSTVNPLFKKLRLSIKTITVNSQNHEHQKYFLNIIVLKGEGQSGVEKLNCKQQW